MEKDFVDWLKSELNGRGWSQSDLARASKINQSTISKMLNRKYDNIHEVTKERIREALGHSTSPKRLGEFDIIRNALLQCPSLDEWDRQEILQTVRLKLERKGMRRAPPAVGRGEPGEAGG